MDVVNEMRSFESQIRKRFNELHTLQGKYDLTEQDILHYIEFEKYDAATGSKLFKRLKEIRVLRREIKDEHEALQSVLKRMNNAGLSNYKRPKKKYTYRVVSLQNVLE